VRPKKKDFLKNPLTYLLLKIAKVMFLVQGISWEEGENTPRPFRTPLSRGENTPRPFRTPLSRGE